MKFPAIVSSLIIFVVICCTTIEASVVASGACDGGYKTRPSSEIRTFYTTFDSSNEGTKSTYNCHWLIDGPIGTPLYLVIDYVRIVGSCPDTSLTFFDGQSYNDPVLKAVCGNITSKLQIPSASNGQIYVVFQSTSGNTKHEFKFSYTSRVEVSEPFEEKQASKIGIILAIVLGTVFIGALFIAGTYCMVKTYMRCKNQDSEPSEMTGVTNLRTERMREQTLKNDYEDRRLSRLVKGTPTTSSTERILEVQCKNAFT